MTNEQASMALGWVLDVDGCLMRTTRAGGSDGIAMPMAAEFLGDLMDERVPFVVCTNASEKRPAEYLHHLVNSGLPIRPDQFITAGSAAADHIAKQHANARTLIVGSEGLAVPLMDNGCDLFDVQSSTGVADVVVVGAARQYDTIVINAACEAVLNGSPLYATVDAPWFHGGVGRSVAISAAVAAAISWVTGVRPIVLGKPSAALASILLDKLDVPATDVSVVGDATTELELARHMGANSILVLSGATSQEDVSTLDDASHPDLVLDDIASLFRLRESIRAKEHPHV